MKREEIEKIFALADQNLLCNTSYPFNKVQYEQFLTSEDILSAVDKLSFYIHIPFCRQLCSFCEYTRFPAGDIAAEECYMDLLNAQIQSFLDSHPVKRLYGFDIGGGTPSALPPDLFERLLSIGRNLEGIAPKSADYEKSIEISFSTINELKLQLIGRYGYTRISAGLQSSDQQLLHKSGRIVTGNEKISEVIYKAHGYGIKKVNLDLMYGLPSQNAKSVDSTILTISQLRPDQVTLYETRYNKYRRIPDGITRDLQFEQYSTLYKGLTSLGYQGRFGSNTFSICGDDGLSSYIRNRMLYCKPYKGFGISAQSMSRTGLSYGPYKSADCVDFARLSSFNEGVSYLLPPEELAAKYISIALYGGRFLLSVLTEILGIDAEDYYHNELLFLKQRGYIEIDNEQVSLTKVGFRYYGAIATLFWGSDQRSALLGI